MAAVDNNDIKGKVISLLGGEMGTAHPSKPPRSKTPKVKVSGRGNVVGVGEHVHIHHQVIERPVIQPDPNAISPAQARKIQNAIERLVNIEAVGGVLNGDRRKLFAKWYRAIKDRYEVPSYRTIRSAQGDELLAWLALMESACLELTKKLRPG
jgi:hypothetical protein